MGGMEKGGNQRWPEWQLFNPARFAYLLVSRMCDRYPTDHREIHPQPGLRSFPFIYKGLGYTETKNTIRYCVFRPIDFRSPC